jgi:ABC-type lipoprotein release transport system permease subunit
MRSDVRSWFRKLTWWVRRRRKEDELLEDLQFHLEEEADERRADGLTGDQASWAAHRDRLLESFLFDLQPNDPGALASAVGILLSAALVAGYGPARKASRIAPMVALRND